VEELEIIKGLKKRNAKIQKLFYESVADKMFRISYRYLANQYDAEDMVADGFIKIFNNIDKFEYKQKGSLEAWCKSVIVNECLMLLRRKKKMTFVEKELFIIDDSETDDLLNLNNLFKEISLMPDGYRTIFNLYEVEGYSHKEISETLQISEQTSKSQLSRAKKYLQTKINTNENEDRKKYRNI